MRGIEVFCERCGASQPVEPRDSGSASSGKIARRLRSAVNGGAPAMDARPTDPSFLRLCLECRGYSCPACWNDEVGICQSCAPLPEAAVAAELPPAEALDPQAKPLADLVPPPLVAAAPEPLDDPIPPIAVRAEPDLAEPMPAQPPEPPAEPDRPTRLPASEPWRPTPYRLLPISELVEAENEGSADIEVVAETRRPAATPSPLPAATTVPPAPVTPAPRAADPVLPAPIVMPRARPQPQPQISFERPAAAPLQPMTLPPPPVAAMPVRLAADPYFLPLPARPTQPVPAGVRPCRNCHLAVSAKAHFCRRCGASQLAS